VPFVAPDKDDVLMVRGTGETRRVMVTVAVCAGLDESVTWKVTLVVLLAVGFPAMTPLAFRLRPGGRALFVMAHMYGAVPPVAFSVAV
jgi:hypothetical protein